jgi:hypothetical protein
MRYAAKLELTTSEAPYNAGVSPLRIVLTQRPTGYPDSMKENDAETNAEDRKPPEGKSATPGDNIEARAGDHHGSCRCRD